MVKTRTVTRREVHIKEMKAVDSVTERLITINRMDVQLEYKLTDAKLSNVLDTDVPSRQIYFRFCACDVDKTGRRDLKKSL